MNLRIPSIIIDQDMVSLVVTFLFTISSTTVIMANEGGLNYMHDSDTTRQSTISLDQFDMKALIDFDGMDDTRDIYTNGLTPMSFPSNDRYYSLVSSPPPRHTTHNSTCSDSTVRFRLEKNGKKILRSCSWVANKDTKNRCSYDGVASMCPKTCDFCFPCYDGEARFKLVWNGRKVTRDCTWVANKATKQRCTVDGVNETCRVTCGSCFTDGGSTGLTDDAALTTDDINTISDDDNSNEEPYVFNQCPESGECCNGLASNCDFRPNELLWATVHNANHDGKLIANHEAPLEQALEAGYRGFMMDACLCLDESGNLEFQFCHFLCGIGYRDPAKVFANIGSFLNNNPTEVIFINLEISHGNPPPSLIWESIILAGLHQKTYIHGDNNFPSMRNLLMNGKQLIISKHNGYDCADLSVEGCVQGIFEYFNEVIETNYDFDDIEAIENSAYSCPGYRGINGKKRFYSINNFVTTSLGPNKIAADIINNKSFLEKRITDCETITGYEVNFVSVDYWQKGDLPQVTQEINLKRAQKR